MLRVFTSGGLGDAAMAYAKMDKILVPFTVTHAEPHKEVLSVISEFYSSQGIEAEVVFPPRGTKIFYRKYQAEFDLTFGSPWHGRGSFPKDDYEINPFPKIKFTPIPFTDIVIQVSAGKDMSRGIPPQHIIQFARKYPERKISLVGRAPSDYEEVNEPNIESFVNLTLMNQFISLICSAQLFIGAAGFGAYIACMAGVKSFIVPEYCNNFRLGSQGFNLESRDYISGNYLHPSRPYTLISSISEISL